MGGLTAPTKKGSVCGTCDNLSDMYEGWMEYKSPNI